MEDKIIIKNYYNENNLHESVYLDLYSSIDADIKVGPIKKINTGICMSIPENFYVSIKDKSSLSSKGLLTIGGAIIDKNYAREIIVMMTSLTEPIKIKKGQKIGKLVISNKKIKSLKKLKEMDKIDSIRRLSDLVFKYFNMYNYKI